MLKQAPCQGQRSLCPLKTPATEKPPKLSGDSQPPQQGFSPPPSTNVTFAEWSTIVWAPTAQGAELLLVPHQQHRVAGHHHLTEPAGEAERWVLWRGARAQPLMAIVALPQPLTWRPPTWLPPAWQPLWRQCQPCGLRGSWRQAGPRPPPRVLTLHRRCQLHCRPRR